MFFLFWGITIVSLIVLWIAIDRVFFQETIIQPDAPPIIDRRKAVLLSQRLLTNVQMKHLQATPNKSSYFAKLIHKIKTTNRNEKTEIATMYEKILGFRNAIGKLLNGYPKYFLDIWELGGYNFVADINENRQLELLCQFLDPMATSTAARLYQDGNYVKLAEYIGGNYTGEILDDDFELLRGITRRISDVCDHAIKPTIDAENYEKFKMAMKLKYRNLAFGFAAYILATTLESRQNELKTAFCMCQKMEKTSLLEPSNKYNEAVTLLNSHYSKCSVELKELKTLTRRNYKHHAQYHFLVLDFYKTSKLTDTMESAQENLGFWMTSWNKLLERTGFSSYQAKEQKYTDVLKNELSERKQLGFLFGKKYCSIIQSMRQIRQYLLKVSATKREKNNRRPLAQNGEVIENL